ncbi:hypothetical protein BJP50_25270 [Paenibacillus odorifer]|nr:hypothetical protein BJP50_25270 [Paenibacillus odorifer]
MGVLEKTIEISTAFRNRQYYIDKGYSIGPGVKKLEVLVEDLPRGCEKLVTPICDACGKVGRLRKWSLVRRDRMYGTDLCSKCMYDINVIIDPGGSESVGEKTVKYWLGYYQLEYRTQVRRKGVTGVCGRPLLFDFAVLGLSGEPIAFIEYDGEQHYRPAVFEGEDPSKSGDNFVFQQEFDRRKDRHCTKAGVPMIRIKYALNVREIGEVISSLKGELLVA